MESDLLYIVEQQRAPGLLSDPGASFEFVVPRTLMGLDPDSLPGRRVWVLARKDAEDVLALVGHVEAVAEIEDEVSKGDFLLELDKRRTFKTVALGSGNAPWAVEHKGEATLVECPPEILAVLENRLAGALGVKVALPLARSAARPWTPLDGSAPVAHELVLVNGTKSIGGLSGYRSLAPLSPIGAEVFQAFTVADADRAALLALVLSLDPLAPRSSSSGIVAPLRFDATLLPLDPNRVFARKYRTSKGLLDVRLGLEKTEAAEKFHQSLVRRLARGFEILKVQPLATRSLDLAFSREGVTHIVEVKSAYAENLVAQYLKGLAQVLYYESEMELASPGRYRGYLLVGSAQPLETPGALKATSVKAKVTPMQVVERPDDESPMVEAARRLLHLASNGGIHDGQG